MAQLMDVTKDVVRTVRREFRALTGHEIHVPRESFKWGVRLGTPYGGWWILPEGLGPQSIVYGVGVGQDVSWDLAMIERFGCTVHAFDPTPRCLRWVAHQQFPSRFAFHPWGLAEYDGTATFVMRSADPEWSSYNPSNDTAGATEVVTLDVRRLTSIMRELGHGHIDVLKLDIEGGEFAVLKDLLAGDVRPRQLLVEYHYWGEQRGNIPAFRESVASLRTAGYRLFARSPNGPELCFVLA